MTPKNIGRIKKMRKKSLRQIEVYSDKKSPSTPISKSTAHRARKRHIKLNFFKYPHCSNQNVLFLVRRWKTSQLNKPYHIAWRGAHARYIVNSWGCKVKENGQLGSFPDSSGLTKWERLVDVDWSSKYGLFGYTNSANDGYWAEDRAQFYAENFRFVCILIFQFFLLVCLC